MVVGVDAGLTLLGVWAPVPSGRLGEAHGLLKRHLERSIPDTVVTVLSRNNSANRLEPTTALAAEDPISEALRDARDAPIVTSTVPSVGVGYTDTGEDVVWPDWAAIARLGEGIRTGTLGEAVAQ